MAYWKGKNTISPVKQEEEDKEEERPVNVAPPGKTPRPAELDTSTTQQTTRAYPDKWQKPE